MDMSKVTLQDFGPFFDVANFTSPPSNALFWSGNKNFANRLAADGTRFTTLEETSTGFILNGLSWCGSEYINGTAPSFDYKNSCQYVQNDTYFGSQGVWNQNSHYFASNVTGNITILLQPQMVFYDHGPVLAYRNTSIFYLIELPSMVPKAITKVTILLLANKTLAPEEFCVSGSLKLLRDDLVAKFGFEPECIDDPDKIIFILCDGGNESTPECMAAYMASHENPPSDKGGSNRGYLVWGILTTCISAVLLVAVVVLAANVVKMKQNQYSPIRQ